MCFDDNEDSWHRQLKRFGLVPIAGLHGGRKKEREDERESKRQASLDYESSMNRGLSAAINQF